MLLGMVAMPGSSAGLVSFASDVTVDEIPSSDFRRVAMAIAGIPWGGSTNIYDAVREVSAYVEGDRELRDDIEQVVGLIDSGSLVRAVEG